VAGRDRKCDGCDVIRTLSAVYIVHFCLSVDVQVMWECETSPRAAEDMTTAAAKVGQTVAMAIPDMWFIKKKWKGTRRN